MGRSRTWTGISAYISSSPVAIKSARNSNAPGRGIRKSRLRSASLGLFLGGLKVTNRLLSQVQDMAANCDPPVKVSFVRHGDAVLEVVVEEGSDKPYRCREGFLLRVGPNSQKLKRNQIRDLIVGAGSFHFDELPNPDCEFPADVDKAKLRRFLHLAGIRSEERR